MKRNSSAAVFFLFALLGAAAIGRAQEQSYPAAEQQAQAAPQQVWSSQQLDNLVAPIALYPDPLLGQILVASTYPLEVVEASQWLQRNQHLRGQALIDAAKKQPWDPSIQALVSVPDALAKLNQDIRWTTDLGNAFLSQQADVMSAVQRMRARAKDNGRLSSTPQQTVSTQEEGGQKVIVIQPANPQVIYVPTYDPVYVWGPPVWGYYPPLYYPTFGFGFGIGFDLGFCFSGWGGWGYWGWGPSWFGHSVYVNNYFFHHHGYHHPYPGSYWGRTAWAHNPGHRMRVPYGTPQVAARFGGHSVGPQNSFRAGGGPGNPAPQYTNRPEGGFAGRTGEQRYRSASTQPQRYQNPQQYQSSQRYQSSYRETPQVQRFQNQQQQRYQAPQEGGSTPRTYGTPFVQRFENQQRQRYQAPRENGSAPQTYGTPFVQRFQSQQSQRYQAPQQYRSAPQMSAPRFSGGSSFNRGGGGSPGPGVSGFSRGFSGSVNRGGGSTFSRGGGGSFSPGVSGFSRGGGGGFSRGGGGSRHR